MNIDELRERKKRLEHDMLELIRHFEEETTILVKKVKTCHATNPQEFPQSKTIHVDVSTIVF